MRAPLTLCIAIAIALAGCGKQSDAPAAAPPPAAQSQAAAPPPVPANATAIRGQIAIEGLSELPQKLQLRLRLLDMTDPSVAPPALAERIEPAPAGLPYRYALPYDAAKINPEGKYVIDAAIVNGDFVLYGTPAPVVVLTQGGGTDALLNLTRGGAPSADIAPADLLKQQFDTLERSIGGMRRLKGDRIENEITVGWDAFADSTGVRFAREVVDYGDAGRASFRFAYKSGLPWVIAREQNGVQTLIGFGDDGTVVLNTVGADGQADEAEVAKLRAQAEEVYRSAAAKN